MAGYSTYPAAFDASFPGYPYIDNTEFIDQTQANAWVSAIQNLESTIGYGQIGQPTSPLYSAAYSATYATLTARIVATEAKVLNGVTINSANANIQPVGSADQAGSTGLAADAGHVHASSASASSYVPVGGIIMWAGPISTIPGGGTYLQCNGQLVSTTTYAALYTALGSGTIYGTSGGSFFLPNFNDRFPIGVNSTAAAVGGTGGSTTITQNNLPAHNHTTNVTDGGHVHNTYLYEVGTSDQAVYTVNTGSSLALPTLTALQQAGISGGNVAVSFNAATHWAAATAGIGVSTNNTGAGTAYTQPFFGVYFLVRAL